MNFELDKLIKSRFTFKSSLNIISVFIQSLCGILLFVLIVIKYDSYTLGIFNLVLSIYIIIGQLGTMGIQISAFHHLAKHSSDRAVSDKIISAAFFLIMILATLVAFAVLMGRDVIADSIFKNHDLSIAILYSVIGLWCLMMNKLFLNIINGFSKMGSYAVFTALRYLVMLAALGVLCLVNISGSKLTLILSISEGFLFIILLIYILRLFSFVNPRRCYEWLKYHCRFGPKSFAGMMLSETNRHIDILMLGFFYSAHIVGIYSFVALIIHGLNQFPGILRTNINPILAKLFFDGEKVKVQQIIRQGTKILAPLLIGLGAISIVVYPVAVKIIFNSQDFMSTWPIFTILMIGSIFLGIYAPFREILIQSGHPGKHTLHILAILLTNIILNFLLIPPFQMLGAAVATSLSFILSILYLKLFTKRILKIQI